MKEGYIGFTRSNPEKTFIRQEEKMDFGALAARFSRQAERALGEVALISLVSEKLKEILSAGPDDQEEICRQLARDHGKFFPDTIEDEQSRAAYALALTFAIDQARHTAN